MFSSVRMSLIGCSPKYREWDAKEVKKERAWPLMGAAILDMLVAVGLLLTGMFASHGMIPLPSMPFYIGAAASFLLPIALTCATSS